MKMKRLLFFVVVAVLTASCADVQNIDACASPDPYGFWWGLWHGWVSPISFIGSLFSDNIAVYGVNNNGGWYDFGFVLGAGILSVSAGRSSKR